MSSNDKKVVARTAKVTKKINLSGGVRRGGVRL